MKTFAAKAGQVDQRWFVIDAEKKVVGRVAEKAAIVLRGKHKATFTPNVDTGDFVVVINAEKAVLTGQKEDKKIYMSYSTYIGGEKLESARKRRERRPELLIQSAVKGMVPHTRLGRAQLKKLHVYAGPEHPHEAQNPQPLSL